MAVPLEKFVKQLEDSGILAGDALKDFLPPKADPKSAEELALELVRHKKLTKFQAEEVSKGRGKSLVLGNYVLMEKIGAGGMGQVFKARHQRMDRLVAVKLLPAAMTKDAAAIARFEREVKAAAKISHPNIVAAHDADCANDIHFLVMELVEGSDLSALVKKHGPFPVQNAVNYILQAAKGLEAAHKKGIVHRDIKPANLLLDTEGTVKILDMGLARIHGEVAQAELTSTGAVMGTVDYMAPEQALNTKTADARADIYSLGCSLHYLLTAHATYDGDTLMARLLAHRERPIPSLRSIRPEVPEQLEAVFRKMVAKTIDERFQTMTEVIAALEGCSSGPTNRLQDKSIASRTVNVSSAKELAVKSQAAPTRQLPRLLADDSPTKTVDDFPAPAKSLRTKVLKNGRSRKQKPAFLKDQKKLLMIGGALVGVVILLAIVIGRLPSRNAESNAAKPAPLEKTAVAGGKPWDSPDFKNWLQSVAAMPAAKQVEAVSKKLVELNPGFDGKLSSPIDESSLPLVQDGNVVELQIVTDKVSDLSPLRALPELMRLQCRSKEKTGQRLDLSPLNGMRIRRLVCLVERLDLSTLKGLPLTDLAFFGGGITDLTPLSGMPLQGLTLSGSWDVTSLEPLKGMPLTYLACDNSQVPDLSPLSGMPLKLLVCHVTRVSDLSPLKGTPLEELYCDRTFITDLSPLAGLKLKRLSFTPNPGLKGLEAIRQMDSLVEIGTAYDKLVPSKIFWKQYDAGAFDSSRESKPVTDVNSPEFQKWMKDVQSLRAEEQIDAVREKLMELNPGFDGKLKNPWGAEPPVVANGIVTMMSFATDDVTDVSPVRALIGLEFLTCVGSSLERGKLRDLSPLKGMTLTTFGCNYNPKLSDLSPLKGMPLTNVNLTGTQVTDLSALRGIPLEDLWFGNTDVSDLSPLQGMPLKNLLLWQTKVADLSPLKGMKLGQLNIAGTPVMDLSPLKDMPLAHLTFNHTGVFDLSPLKGMPLAYLNLQASHVWDLSPLEGMNLNVFVFTPRTVTKGIDVIRQMKSLKTIGTGPADQIPAAEFWKKYDAGQFTKPTP